MIQFEKLTRDGVEKYAPYFANNGTHISDFSLGFQFMWCNYMQSACAVVENCLVIKEVFEGRTYFHYPLSKNNLFEEEIGAIEALERHCRDNAIALHFTNVPREKMPLLALRYGDDVRIENPRAWRDYLYRAEDFRKFAGGKYAGQRNHVNKFLKNNPSWSFRPYREGDEGLVRAFLTEYEASVRGIKCSELADEELDEACLLLSRILPLGLLSGLLFVQEKLVAFTVGERCGDMLVVHIEKGLRSYEGVYPFVAQQFALRYAAEVGYLNRMDDAADRGLRKSKLQYLPCELVDKFNVTPRRAIERIKNMPTVLGKRIKIAPITAEHAENYFRLASDVERNRYWGYDYRVDLEDGEIATAEWFLSGVTEDFAGKVELSEGIFVGDRLVGEVALHRFGYRQEVEVGARLLPEYEGKGYASEAISVMSDYAFMTLGVERVEAKCFRQNERSAKMLKTAGFRPCGEDGQFFYFFKTPVS